MFWSQHLGCWGQNTSRIQNKGVYATLCLQARSPHSADHTHMHHHIAPSIAAASTTAAFEYSTADAEASAAATAALALSRAVCTPTNSHQFAPIRKTRQLKAFQIAHQGTLQSAPTPRVGRSIHVSHSNVIPHILPLVWLQHSCQPIVKLHILPLVSSQYPCQPTVQLHILPLVWMFPLGKG